MRAYFNKLMMYHEIHKMKRDGFSDSRISRELVMSRHTVRRYLSMSEEDYNLFLEKQSNRKRELQPYEDFVKAKLETFPDTSASQMHDWLKEHYSAFPDVSPKTVYNFLMWVRQKYGIPKITVGREYSIIEETDYGKQAQVDFGEYNMRDTHGKRVKVYFFSQKPVSSKQTHPDSDLHCSELQRQIDKAIAELPFDLRAAIITVTIDETPMDEAVFILGCNKATLYWRIHKARKLLKEVIKPS